MKILIIILSIIGGIVALVLITAAFVKKEYTVEREILIDKPVQTVFDYVRMLKNQENYSVWVMQDPNQKTTLTGVDGTKGAIFSWNGNDQAGEGEQEIKDIAEGKKIEQEIRFKRPFKGLKLLLLQNRLQKIKLKLSGPFQALCLTP